MFHKKYTDNKSSYNHIQMIGGFFSEHLENKESIHNVEKNEFINNVHNILKKYFSSFSLEIEPYVIFESEPCAISVYINCLSDNLFRTTEFYIYNYDSKIFIDSLAKCGTESGTHILKNIINTAKDFNVKKIETVDFSYVYIGRKKNQKCNVRLAYLYILIKGHSWYNEYGFLSNEYEDEKKYNDSIISENFITFVNRVFSQGKKKEFKRFFKEVQKIDQSKNEMEPQNKSYNDVITLNSLSGLIILRLKDYNNIDEFKEKGYKLIKQKFNKKIKKKLLKDIKMLVPDYITFGSVKNLMNHIYNNYIKNNEINDCSSKAQVIKKIVFYSETILRYNTMITLTF